MFANKTYTQAPRACKFPAASERVVAGPHLYPSTQGMQVSTPFKQLNNLSIYYYAFFLLRLLLGPCILGFVALGILGNPGPRISLVS